MPNCRRKAHLLRCHPPSVVRPLPSPKRFCTIDCKDTAHGPPNGRGCSHLHPQNPPQRLVLILFPCLAVPYDTCPIIRRVRGRSQGTKTGPPLTARHHAHKRTPALPGEHRRNRFQTTSTRQLLCGFGAVWKPPVLGLHFTFIGTHWVEIGWPITAMRYLRSVAFLKV